VPRVPVAEGLQSGDTDIRKRKNAVGRGQIRQRIDFLTPAAPQNRSTNEKEWNIGADFGGYAKLFRARQRSDPVLAKFALQSDERGNRICGASAEAALYRKAFVYMDVNLSGGFQGTQGEIYKLEGSVALVRGHKRIIASDRDSRILSRARLHGNEVVRRKRLVEGGESVKSVWSSWADGKAEVDLRKRANGGGHAASIVVVPG